MSNIRLTSSDDEENNSVINRNQSRNKIKENKMLILDTEEEESWFIKFNSC